MPRKKQVAPDETKPAAPNETQTVEAPETQSNAPDETKPQSRPEDLHPEDKPNRVAVVGTGDVLSKGTTYYVKPKVAEFYIQKGYATKK